IANILAAAGAGFAREATTRIGDWEGIVSVGPHLLAADIELRRPVDRVGEGAGGNGGCEGCDGLAARMFRRLQIFAHAFRAAFAPEAAFAIAAETAGGVEHVGAVDPDDAGLEARGRFQCPVDVLAPDGSREPVA